MANPDALQPLEPPHSLESEQSVLGSLLLDSTAIDRIGNLRPEHFYSGDHRQILQAILDTAEDSGTADIVTVSERLKRNSGDGKLAYLGTLAQFTPSAHNIGRYAEIVLERAQERALLGALSKAWEIVQSAATPFADKLDHCQAALMSVSEAETHNAVHVGDVARSHVAELERRASGKRNLVPTYFADIDEMLGGGMSAGDLLIVGARPSVGKTSLAVNIAEHNVRNGRPCLVFSMEMSAAQLLDRIAAGISRIPLAEIRSGKSSTHSHVTAALKEVQRWPLFIDDSSGLTAMQIRSKARSVKRRNGLALVVIDYLQLMPGAGENRNSEISGITRALKGLAKDLNIPVVLLSQLNRASENRAGGRPLLADLRDSGAIEQDADVVMLLHKPAGPEWGGKAELLVRKNRQGETGDVRLAWLGPLTRFEDFAGDWPSETVRPMRRRAFGDE